MPRRNLFNHQPSCISQLVRDGRGMWFHLYFCMLFKIMHPQEHQRCSLVDYKPYGQVRSCTATILKELSLLITSCQHFLPTLSASIVVNKKIVDRILGQNFVALSTNFDDQFYLQHMSRMKKLLALENNLTPLIVLKNKFSVCIKRHDTLPSDSVFTTICHNLCYLQIKVFQLRNSVEGIFYQVLDSEPDKTEAKLRSMMREVSIIVSTM